MHPMPSPRRAVAAALLPASLAVLAAAHAWSADAGDPPAPTAREKIRAEAVAVRPLAESALGRAFLDASAELPPMMPRKVWFDRKRRSALAPEAYVALPDPDRAGYEELDVSEDWYYRLYSSPLAYLRALDFAAAAGLESIDGARIADFGFGNMGQVRALAMLGAHVTGIEIGGMLDAMYRLPDDRGPIARAKSAGRGKPGDVQLVFGQYPSTEAITHEVGSAYDLFMSKNTLKMGYIHPERDTDPRNLVHLGVDDSTYIAHVHDALAPGGLFVIYNLYGQQAAPTEPYRPWATGECPFERGLMERAGFEILRWNEDDSKTARDMGRALGWNANMDDTTFVKEFNAMVTVARRAK
jgi:hypothetical protein